MVPPFRSLSAIIPGWARHVVDTRGPGKLSQLARRVFDISEADDAAAARQGVDAFEEWCDRIGSPKRISHFGIGAGDVPRIVENANGTAVAWGLSGTYDPQTIEAIVRRCL